jgi:hypothetical protein
LRGAIRAGTESHHAGFGLIVHIMGCDLSIWARLTKTGDRTIDKLGIQGVDLFKAKAKAIHHTRTELLDNDVRLADQGFYFFARDWILEVGDDGFFATIKQGKVDAILAELRRVGAHIIAFGTFDLDDIGACIGQKQGTHGTGQEGAEIENLDAMKGLHRART